MKNEKPDMLETKINIAWASISQLYKVNALTQDAIDDLFEGLLDAMKHKK